MKRWTQIFKAFANVNRLKIITLLADGRRLHVSDITRELRISFTATSRHLILLSNLNVLEADGKDGHVFYFLNPHLPNDLRKAIHLIVEK